MAENGGRIKMSYIDEEQEQLIPCIPDEIATECLVRIPHRFHSTLKLVSHGWRSLLSDSLFYSNRKLAGLAEHLVFLVQPVPFADSAPTAEKAETERGSPAYSLSVCNLTRGEWQRLTMSFRVPMFCQVAASDEGKVVLVGGWDPETLEPVDEVYVIDLVAGTWRRGSPMPTARSFFALAVSGGRVYVAGGHDGQKNALRSGEVYDVARDQWSVLPPMEEERDECLGFGFDGGFMVVSGYGTDSQGRFREDGEWFDPGRGCWVKTEGLWPFESVTPRATAVEGRRWWWMGDSGEIREFDWREMRWKVGPTIVVPRGSSLCVVDLGDGGGLFVMGGDGGFVVEAGGRVCREVQTPPSFLGLPFSTCHLLI